MRRFAALTAAVLLAALPALTADTPAPAREWQTLEKCRLISSAGNDGDSFHVRYNGREYVFRLYFVDAPETDLEYPVRVEAQAAYFDITVRQALNIAADAARFTRNALSRPFTITTRWQDALGSTPLGRQYGMVTVDGRDLAELLVENGLARIHGINVAGIGAEKVAKLKALEAEAKKARRGAWRYSVQNEAP